ncbi:O-antigen polymerase [Alteromonas aestuariivivens]|nr:O-antigen polymerase [Alteromonas aestuariivivens]
MYIRKGVLGSLVIVMALCTPVLILSMSADKAVFGSFIALLAFSLLTFIHLARGNRDFLYSAVLSFFYVFLFLAPALQVYADKYPWIGRYSSDEINYGYIITFLSLVGFGFGYELNKKFGERKQSDIKYVLSNRGAFRLYIVGLVCIFVGIAFLGMESIISPRNMATDSVLESLESSAVASILQSFFRVSGFLCLVILIVDWISNRKSLNQSQITHRLLMIGSLFLIVMFFNNPVSTARFWFGCIVLSLFLIYIVYRTKYSAGFWFLLNIAIVTCVFPLMDLYRNSLETSVVEAVVNLDTFSELSTSPDFDAFQQQLNTVRYTNLHDHSFGLQTLSSLLFFVPRNVWPSKAQPTGKELANKLGYHFDNLSAPLSAEFYMDGWLFMVVGGMFALGFIYRFFYNRFRTSTDVFSVSFFIFMSCYQMYFLRGSLMAVIGYMVVGMAILFLIRMSKGLFFIQSKH